MQKKNARHVIAKERSDCGNLTPCATKTVYFFGRPEGRGNPAKPSRAQRGISSVATEILRYSQDTGKPVDCFAALAMTNSGLMSSTEQFRLL